jgi:hypothetical protein
VLEKVRHERQAACLHALLWQPAFLMLVVASKFSTLRTTQPCKDMHFEVSSAIPLAAGKFGVTLTEDVS